MGFWAKITGADKRKKFPEQAVTMLGKNANGLILFPYGYYADLPDESFLRKIGKRIFLSCTVDRPDDVERGEPVFYHPATNTRIIPRNDGSLDIETGTGGTAPVNIKCTQANITASDSVTFDTPTATFTGDLDVNGEVTADAAGSGVSLNGHKHDQPNDSGGNTEQPTESPTPGT